MVRSGIKVMLAEMQVARRFEVMEAANTEELLQKARKERFHIFLIAHDLAGRGGIVATQLLVARQPKSMVLGLLNTVDRQVTEQMVKAGSRGCVLKCIEAATLVDGIRTVLAGRLFYSNDLAVALLEPETMPVFNRLGRLTNRERALLKAIMRGMPTGEIAAEWGVGKRTVDKHREHLKTKLGVRNMVGLVMAGIGMFG
jgi:DNA-binding NarL/FixJ family response regulator